MDVTVKGQAGKMTNRPKTSGKTIDLEMEYNYRSPYLVLETGRETLTVCCGSRRWEYDFGKNTVKEIQ